MPNVSRPPPGRVVLRIWASQILDHDFFHLLHFTNEIHLQQVLMLTENLAHQLDK